ncbi:MAG: HD domain-containing protein [Erysipelotrichaceae bacterium]|nr:HD domain-containing protein [Erysipelotrichaceae bacterium]
MINNLYLEMIKLYKGEPKRIQHFTKVHSYCQLIGEMEKLNKETMFILETAALVHDIAIKYCEEKYQSHTGDLQEIEGPALAKELLDKLNFDKKVNERVQYLVGHHHTYDNIDGIYYQILVEADFIVNIYEGNKDKQTALYTYEKIFKTECGKQIFRDMFNLEV